MSLRLRRWQEDDIETDTEHHACHVRLSKGGGLQMVMLGESRGEVVTILGYSRRLGPFQRRQFLRAPVCFSLSTGISSSVTVFIHGIAFSKRWCHSSKSQ